MVLALFAIQFLTPRPGAKRQHCQNRKRRELELRIAERGPRQRCQHRVCAQSHQQPIHRNTELLPPQPAQQRRAPGAPKTWCTGEDSNLRSSQGAADLQSAAINHSATCAHDWTEHSHPVPRPGTPGSCCQRTPPNRRPTKLRNSRAPILPRVFRWLAAAGISSLGELRVSFGLLLLPPASRGALGLRFWSWRRDLNPRPSDYKSDALPAELRQPAWFTPPRADLPRHNSSRQPGQTLRLARRQSACKAER